MESRIRKVLAIDDNQDNLISLKALIYEAFPTIVTLTALNGKKGLELAAIEDPDVILLDIVMPGMDGYEVCQKLKDDKNLCDIPVVFVTALKGDKESRIRALECGADAFLAKPIDESELTAQIRAMIKIKTANVERRDEKIRLASLVEEKTRELNCANREVLSLFEVLRQENEARILSEEALKKSEEYLRRIIASSNDCIKVLDLEGHLLSLSEGGQKLLEIENLQPYLGLSWIDFWKEDKEGAQQVIAKAARGEIGIFHGYCPTVKGRPKWWEVVVSPIIGNDNVIENLLAVSRDMTERKLADEQLLQSRELLFNLTNLVPGVVYQYRLYPDGCSSFPYSSQGMNDIYEVTPEEVREDATPVFGRLHPDDFNNVSSLILESARTLQTFYCEFRVILPRQGLRWRWSQAQPERMPDGGTLWHGIILDITERMQTEEAKKNLEDQLHQAQKMESVGRLAGGVAHDFNNLLTVILGGAYLALMEVAPDQPLHEYITSIQKAAEKSAELTQQLLAFARKQTIMPKVLDLNETVTNMIKMLKRLIGEDVELTWQPEENLWPVKADPSQIDQMLANLCVNARDAISNTGTITIKTGNCIVIEDLRSEHVDVTPGEYVTISVSDDGCGMDKETVAHIFEPFFTTKGVGEGTGLGLAMVYGAVKQNNGFINVSSESGMGTKFTIYLPRYSGTTDQMLAKGQAQAAQRGMETILLVEDELTILNMTMMLLTKQGYTVLIANTAVEASRLASEHSAEIDLLITDVIMPEMNGKDLANNLMSLYPKLKCLYMSGYTANVISQHGVLDEGMHFIQKPFSLPDLAAKVRNVLDR